MNFFRKKSKFYIHIESNDMRNSPEDLIGLFVELNSEINSIILRLEQQDIKAISDVYLHFLPTSTFQEHSMMNNWIEKYMKLAEKFDHIYERNKNYA